MTQMTRRGLFAAVVAALWRPKKPLIVAPAVRIAHLWEGFRYQKTPWPRPGCVFGEGFPVKLKMYRFKEIG